jgi:hypothetical protein
MAKDFFSDDAYLCPFHGNLAKSYILRHSRIYPLDDS